MKTGIIYNVFDGAELLEPSIKSIRGVFDEVVVVFQTRSYYGNVIKEYDIKEVIKDLCNSKLIDTPILLDFPDNARNTWEAKTMHRHQFQIGLKALKKNKIDYFHMSATDEFFIEEELKKALQFVKKNNINRSFCHIQTYSGLNERDIEMTDHVMSNLFYKNLGEQEMLKPSTMPVYIDKVFEYGTPGSDHVFEKTDLMMHHYRLLRIDNNLRMKNSAISNREFLQNQINNLDSIKSKAEKSKNIFNINLDDFRRRYYK